LFESLQELGFVACGAVLHDGVDPLIWDFCHDQAAARLLAFACRSSEGDTDQMPAVVKTLTVLVVIF
jgi:hypothetical protein